LDRGVSTRGYERSLGPVDESIETRGASKSDASRGLIDATTERLVAAIRPDATVAVEKKVA